MPSQTQQNNVVLVSKIMQFLFVCFLASFMIGCTPIGLAVGGGTAIGMATTQEGGLRVASTDVAIRVQIHDLWLKHSVDMYRRLDMTVREGRVLVTGTLPDPDMRVDAIRLAWLANGVHEVINEINVDNGNGVVGFVGDSIITGRLKTKLVLDKKIQSVNFSIDTVDKVIYLMGVAQNGTELDHVLNHARRLPRIENVVSYVRLRGEMPPALEPMPQQDVEYTVPARPHIKPVEQEMLYIQ